MEYIPVELWINENQEERWKKDAEELNISLFSYIRRAVDFYWQTRQQLESDKNICEN